MEEDSVSRSLEINYQESASQSYPSNQSEEETHTYPTQQEEKLLVSLMEDFKGETDLILVGMMGYLAAYTGQLEKIWKVNIKRTMGIVHFVSINDFIYALTHSTLVCVNKLIGEISWSKTVPDLSKINDTHLNKWNDHYLICSGSGYVTTYSLVGDLIWKTNLKGAGYSEVITSLNGDVVYAGTRGRVFALSVHDGSILWKNKLPGKGFTGTSFAFLSNTVFVGIAGYIVKLDLNTGKKIGTSSKIKSTLSRPINQLIWKDHLLIGSNGSITCINMNTCEEVWRNNLKGLGYYYGFSFSIFPSEPSSLIVGFHGRVISIQPVTGETEWVTSLPYTSFGFVSVTIYKELIVALSRGYVYALNRKGEILFNNGLGGLGIDDGILGINNALDASSSNLVFARRLAKLNRTY
eukprot:TRINITY_DN7241_c0_g1_i7.p1 TRINITY_DN7241_c0_g1~~TRINITY_DN7241_c0_g1_i7.p1  ORF type:complete len:408 (-),score=92.08 TRINITY_DN7241_c0_g1_i7:33-1256(-)